ALFPQYDYDDMVAAQHELLEKGLGVNHLRLVLGTSMGCMHSWVWGETYPDFMDALMPLACLPVQIAGRNRVWRDMVIQGIREDPDWKGGDYTTEPRAALQVSADFLIIAGSAPPELGIAEREIKKVKNGRFVLIPISEKTHGHGTHTDAAVWQEHLKELLDSSQH